MSKGLALAIILAQDLEQPARLLVDQSNVSHKRRLLACLLDPKPAAPALGLARLVQLVEGEL